MEKSNNKCIGNGGGSSGRFRLCCLITFSLWLYIVYCNSPKQAPAGTDGTVRPADRCAGRYIYVHSLPSKFNSDLIAACHDLNQWMDMCPFVVNDGLGPPINASDDDDDGVGGGAVFSETGWYATNQFTLELIFHSRIRQYECVTTDSSLASVVYVPYYPGLDIGRHLWGYNVSVRDSTALELVRWLRSRPEWAAMGGRDHFLVAGRITWDFRRVVTEDGDWGSNFLFMPEAKNMTCLVIESSPWHANDFAVPYPTYFHPSSAGEIVAWQERMRAMERPWLFSFAGAPRPNMTGSIRGQLIEQCRSSGRCKLLECHLGVSKCDSPSSVMHMFQSSVFCLQPQGDSYTRRSVFDAMLAGCIPVFFHPGTAYVQYVWHLPKKYSTYSVFISEDEVREGKVRVEEVLERVTGEEVRRMREEVVRMIPRLVYRAPGAKMEEVKDAFDVAIEGVIRRVENARRDLREGVPVEVEDEQNSWKYGLIGGAGEHEWDHFFNHGKD